MLLCAVSVYVCISIRAVGWVGAWVGGWVDGWTGGWTGRGGGNGRAHWGGDSFIDAPCIARLSAWRLYLFVLL